ncbi:hypothetical protein [Pseudomonas sp. P108]|uniref:hypothetical protein n=1 Tax=Pseudomonas sp. P108 TaxID=1837993 RepID=UPI0029344B5E|nr:hypothetical protein [Pseudomonas sp. P108]WNZ87558.1 hypothetical protein QOM10_30190 [Pseudomonas sp. P108]
MSIDKSNRTLASSPNQGALATELVAMLGSITDSVMADLVKAFQLNGRPFASLSPTEVEAFEFFRMQGRKYGVVATVTSDADPVELAKAGTRQQKDEILRRADSTVCVALYDNLAKRAADRWNANADEYNQWDALGQDEKDELIAAELMLIENGTDTHR